VHRPVVDTPSKATTTRGHRLAHDLDPAAMQMISRLSVKSRLALLVALALAASLLIAAAGGLGLQRASASGQVVIDRHVPAVGALSELRAQVGNLRRFEKDLFLNLNDAKLVSSYRERWNKTLADTQATLDRLVPLVEADATAQIATLRSGLEAYGRGFTGLADRVQGREFTDPAVANAEMEPLKAEIRTLDQTVAALKERIDGAAAAERETLAAVWRNQLTVQLTVLLVVAGLLVALGWAIVRSITQPLALASSALERLAEGDLSETLNTRGRDELAQMMGRLSQTQRALRQLVQSIQGNAQSVASASVQIAQGNLDLSQRTERQAASLQETAASMEQLTATVRQGATHAQQASELTRAARDGATRGGEVVARVVQTMSGIQDASRRIADITGVIDGIAFQTNILALNAAVEAARAGEQGRGFAVVAAEVRALAQKSAGAAKEIKALIGESVERVEAGHVLVQRAGGSIGEVVEQVRRVDALVAELSTAALEQQQGITQVGQAVAQLDQATQQNAALVEESTAAADSLRQQAEQLAAATAVFRLGAASR
jgi:methyl-accepting chemotaxis protein